MNENVSLFAVNNRLDNLTADANIVKETLYAVSGALAEGIHEPENLGWALVGLCRSAEKLVKDMEELSEDSFSIFQSFKAITK